MAPGEGKPSSFPSLPDCIAQSFTGQRKAGHLIALNTCEWEDPQDQCLTLQLKLLFPESLTSTPGAAEGGNREAEGHSGKPFPYPALHNLSQMLIMQGSPLQPLLSRKWAHGRRNALHLFCWQMDEGVTNTLDPMGWLRALLGGRGDKRGVAQGRHLHCRAWPGGAHISPAAGFCFVFRSLPAHVSTAWSCPRWDLCLWPHVCSLPLLTAPIPAPVCPALPCSLSLCVQGPTSRLHQP